MRKILYKCTFVRLYAALNVKRLGGNNLVFPEDNITFVLNKSAILPGAPQSERNRGAIKVVVLAKNLLDMASGLLGVIVRHSGEEMMSDVGVRNVMMHVVNE
jgi:hypothetical protein